MVAHGIPYVAQSTFIGNFRDLHEKAKKAIYTQGPCLPERAVSLPQRLAV